MTNQMVQEAIKTTDVLLEGLNDMEPLKKRIMEWSEKRRNGSTSPKPQTKISNGQSLAKYKEAQRLLEAKKKQWEKENPNHFACFQPDGFWDSYALKDPEVDTFTFTLLPLHIFAGNWKIRSVSEPRSRL